jgi:hypothetical protein
VELLDPLALLKLVQRYDGVMGGLLWHGAADQNKRNKGYEKQGPQ